MAGPDTSKTGRDTSKKRLLSLVGVAALMAMMCASGLQGAEEVGPENQVKKQPPAATAKGVPAMRIKAAQVMPAVPAVRAVKARKTTAEDKKAVEALIAEYQARQKQQREAEEASRASDTQWAASHAAGKVIDAADTRVTDFCMDKHGNLWVCVPNAKKFSRPLGVLPRAETEEQTDAGPHELRKLNNDGTEYGGARLDFTPQAVAADTLGRAVYVAGEGEIRKIDAFRGTVLTTAQTPGMAAAAKALEEAEAALEALGEEAPEEAEPADAEASEENCGEECTLAEEAAEEEAADKEDDKEAAKRALMARIAAATGQQQELTPEQKAQRDVTMARYQAARAKTVTSMAVSEQDVFLCCPDGNGYAVWRMTLDLEEPVKIVSGLRGCCGQMNIAAYEGDLWVPHNAKHCVEQYDREGELISKFGVFNRTAADGFGGCCEPKNICFVDGQILTAESGPPEAVKKWTLDGEFQGVVCLPKFERGCVRMTIQSSGQGETVYVLDLAAGDIHSFTDTRYEATHEQVGKIRPLDVKTEDGESVEGLLASFCVDKQDRILALCGGEKRSYVMTESGYEVKTQKFPSEVRVLDLDGKLLEKWPLPAQPRSIGVGPDGKVYVGLKTGLAVLNSDGELLDQMETPIDESRIPTREKAEEAARRSKAMMDYSSKVMKARQEGGDMPKPPTPEEVEKTEVTEEEVDAYLERLRASLALYSEITGVAVTDKDVFVARRGASGYDIVRMDHSLDNPVTIAKGFRGCCGQMDIQPDIDGGVVVAENARFNVVRLDRDGKELSRWGKGDRTGLLGFGSCCNPMNARIDADGNIYTSESNVGRVKKYTPDGQCLGHVGSAVIQGGCKHVAIDFSNDGSRLYVLDITYSEIAVLKVKE